MTQHDKARELVKIGVIWLREIDMHDEADAITAQADENRRLREAVEAVIQFHNSSFSGPCAAQNKGRQWKGVLRKCLNASAVLDQRHRAWPDKTTNEGRDDG